MKTQSEAFALLPVDAVWSCSFGWPGEGGFNEYYRQPDGTRWKISNGSYLGPRDWTCTKVGPAATAMFNRAEVAKVLER